MTMRKYTRLFIVSCIPLLILGFALSIFVIPYGQYAHITCAPSLTGRENCRNVGDPEGSLYQSVKSEHPAWFDIRVGEYDEKSYLKNFVEGSARIIPRAEIVKASPFYGHGPDVASFMGSLVGRNAIVNLGISENRRSVISNDITMLYCNDIQFEETPGEYTSGCYGNGWSGPVTYRVIGAGKSQLDELINSINSEISDRKSDYNIYRIVIYPIFIYLFFIMSFITWLAIKAVRFVKSG